MTGGKGFIGSMLALLAVPALAQPAQAPPSGDVPRASFIQTMDAEFRAKDADKDGKLTRAELELFERTQAWNAALAGNRQLFVRLDADRNGQLSAAEFGALVGQPKQPDVAPLMQRFDTNRDQIVTQIEYRAATLANFDRLDTDHDGTVTQAEMRAGGVQPVGR